MKWIKNLILGLGLTALVGACLKQPEYSVKPEISFTDLYFKPGSFKPDLTILDSLVIKFDFKDGDGDLGVTVQDSSNLDAYNPWYYVYNTSPLDTVSVYTKSYTLKELGPYKYLNYAARRTVPEIISLNLPDLNCAHWEEIKDDRDRVIDTFYIKQNPKAFNFFMELYQKNSNGDYVLFDPVSYFSFPACNTIAFQGAFKDLASDGGKSSPIEGTFRYNFLSAATNLLFGSSVLKLRCYIYDRAGHQSNVLEKKDFTLASIRR